MISVHELVRVDKQTVISMEDLHLWTSLNAMANESVPSSLEVFGCPVESLGLTENFPAELSRLMDHTQIVSEQSQEY